MRLLVAIDGTDASDTALDYALDIAARLDASLLLAYAIEPPARATADGDDETESGPGNGSERVNRNGNGGANGNANTNTNGGANGNANTNTNGGANGNGDTRFVRDALEDARTTGDRVLHDAANRASVAGVDVERRLVSGDPVERLPELAAEASVDGIVVGHRRDVDHHEVVNSVAKGLIERSSVPVTVVP
jgi:nucleotide-binding universal stress UspA family protein